MVYVGVCCQLGEKNKLETAMQTGVSLQTGAGFLKANRYEPFETTATVLTEYFGFMVGENRMLVKVAQDTRQTDSDTDSHV